MSPLSSASRTAYWLSKSVEAAHCGIVGSVVSLGVMLALAMVVPVPPALAAAEVHVLAGQDDPVRAVGAVGVGGTADVAEEVDDAVGILDLKRAHVAPWQV